MSEELLDDLVGKPKGLLRTTVIRVLEIGILLIGGCVLIVGLSLLRKDIHNIEDCVYLLIAGLLFIIPAIYAFLWRAESKEFDENPNQLEFEIKSITKITRILTLCSGVLLIITGLVMIFMLPRILNDSEGIPLGMMLFNFGIFFFLGGLFLGYGILTKRRVNVVLNHLV